MRKLAKLSLWMLHQQMRIEPKRIFKVILGMPRFVRDFLRFKKLYGGNIEILPCVTDWDEEGGTARGEYFWQDLYVARKINKANPRRHVDIGSRVDGFVAHVASFRSIEVIDIRPIRVKVPGMIFSQADLMRLEGSYESCTDSISCLHALEHFGLGRYGDPINPLGHEVALQNMSKMLSEGGIFYLAVPIGRARVEFNGLRVFDPKYIEKLAAICDLALKEFSYIGANDVLTTSSEPMKDFENIATQEYALGIYIFHKRPCRTL